MGDTSSHSLSKRQYIIKQLVKNVGFFFILAIATQIIILMYTLKTPDCVFPCVECCESLYKQYYLYLKTILMSLSLGILVFSPFSLLFYWISTKFFNRSAMSTKSKPLRISNRIYFYYIIRF